MLPHVQYKPDATERIAKVEKVSDYELERRKQMSKLEDVRSKIADGLVRVAEATEKRASMFDLEPGAELQTIPMVVGVGICVGDDVTSQDGPGADSLVLYMSEPIASANALAFAASAFGLEALCTDVPVQIVHTGPIDALAHRFHMRPAPSGISIGHKAISAGTLGCLCRGTSGERAGRTLVLSNNHVLADVNAGSAGDEIVQPGVFDGGKLPADVIGGLERYVTINFPGPNRVDAATAVVDPSMVRVEHVHLKGTIPNFFRVGTTPSAATIGMTVGKSGRTTQLTTGRVFAINVTINVNMGGGRVATFDNQIDIVGLSGSFSGPGDSGSLIWTWDDARNPIGLLFAGGGGHTFANPIDEVLKLLDIVLL